MSDNKYSLPMPKTFKGLSTESVPKIKIAPPVLTPKEPKYPWPKDFINKNSPTAQLIRPFKKDAESIYPTAVEFSAKIETYKNDIVIGAVCRHCGGKIGAHLKIRKVQARYTEQQINDIALVYLKDHHNCPRKVSQWGDKGLLHRIAPDIMRGWEKLKEATFKAKA